MSDIVERLRERARSAHADRPLGHQEDVPYLLEAADEIERLRTAPTQGWREIEEKQK